MSNAKLKIRTRIQYPDAGLLFILISDYHIMLVSRHLLNLRNFIAIDN